MPHSGQHRAEKRDWGHHIGGVEVLGDGERLSVGNPATGETWATVGAATAGEVDRAVAVARESFEGEWSTWRAADRAAFLHRFGAVIGEHAEELATLQVRENGKLYREMLGQTKLLPEFFAYYAGLALGPSGRMNPVHVTDMISYTTREPMGVVAAVTPWNSPILLLVWKLGPALAAGNTVVAKPSEVTPVSTIRLAELALEAGLPAGVFNVVTGGVETGQSLVSHRGVDRIAFTGSTAAGRAIAAAGAGHLARVSLELGGKSPNIDFADADLESATSGLVAGIFGAGGQTCMAGSRILIERPVYDDVVDRLTAAASAVQVGDPFDPASQMGAVACEPQLRKIQHYVELGGSEGARLVAGGETPVVEGYEGGLWARPTVFADVTNEMAVAQEEIFGPVASLIPFDDEDDAVRIANDTEFGLAAGVWTQNLARGHRMANRTRAGTVWVNNYRKTGYSVPFGGYKQSGIGRENGPDALREYTEEKSVWIDIGQGIKDPFNPRAGVGGR
jgi:aldehyde dehydrogenase (NAD+)